MKHKRQQNIIQYEIYFMQKLKSFKIWLLHLQLAGLSETHMAGSNFDGFAMIAPSMPEIRLIARLLPMRANLTIEPAIT